LINSNKKDVTFGYIPQNFCKINTTRPMVAK